MVDAPTQTDRSPLGPAAVYGFGTAVAMWIVGFLTHMPGLEAPAWLVGVLLIGTQLGAAILAGRHAAAHGAVHVGILTGLLAGVLNLLILGGVLAPEDPTEGLPAGWIGTVGAFLGYSVVASGVGGWLGGLLAGHERATHPLPYWLARFGIVAAVSVVPVLFSGGLVTSHQAGLAVPDWPNSYGALMFLYPVSRMTGGIYYEHAHRLFGSLAGLGVIALLLFVLAADRRRWVRWSAVAALLAVVAQGILGGVGVAIADGQGDWQQVAATAAHLPDEIPADFALTTDNAVSASMRMVHGVTGQMTFAWIAVVAAFLSLRWLRSDSEQRTTDTALSRMCVALMIVLTLQLTLGAASRHFQHFHIALTHTGFALFVVITALACAFRAFRHASPLPLLGKIIVGVLILQVVLGFATLFLVLPYDSAGPKSMLAVTMATMHQATGAALYCACALLTCWAFRLTARTPVPAHENADASVPAPA